MAEGEAQDPSFLSQAASFALDVTPFVGTGKSIGELITGEDLVTGEKVNRWFAAGGIVIGLIPFGKAVLKGGKAAIKSRKIAKRIATGGSTAAEAIKKGEKVLEALPTPKSTSAASSYSGSLLSEQLRLQEKNVGHSFAKHSAQTSHKTVKVEKAIRSKEGKVLYQHESVVVSHAGEPLGVSAVSKKTASNTHKFNIENRGAFEKFVKGHLDNPGTKKIPLGRGRTAYVNEKTKTILFDQHNPLYEGTIYRYDKLPDEVLKGLKSYIPEKPLPYFDIGYSSAGAGTKRLGYSDNFEKKDSN